MKKQKVFKTTIRGLLLCQDEEARNTVPLEEMTDMEKLQAENRLLKAQLRDKEAEMLLIKNCRNWKGVVIDRSQTGELIFGNSIHT